MKMVYKYMMKKGDEAEIHMNNNKFNREIPE